MKALSVQQPWATLIVEGRKKIEVRSWKTDHRGPMVICASASPKNVFWFDEVEKEARLMHAGCIIGVVELLDCRPMVESDEDDAKCKLQNGAWSWVLKPLHYCRPDRVTGRLGFFDVPESNLVKIANDETDWIFNYPTPQGIIKYTDRCPVLE